MEDWMLNRLEEIKTRFKDLEVMMTKPEIISNQVQMTKISKEYRNLENVNVLWNSYQNISNEINENKELIDSEDIDMSELASSENEELEKELAKIEVSDKIREQEAVKMIRFKSGFNKLVVGYLDLAEKVSIIVCIQLKP